MPAGALLPAGTSKELRLRMRGWRWAAVLTLYVGLLALVATGFLLHAYTLSPARASAAGLQLFQALSLFQLWLIVFVTPASLAGTISGERQRRTWELLLASRLSSLEIVWGKLLAGLAFNLILVAASIPLFGLVFLFGGVPGVALLRVFLLFLATILLLSCVSLTISSLTAQVTVAVTLSLLVSLALAAGITLLALYLQAPGEVNLIAILAQPLQGSSAGQPLPPLAQVDPLLALLSALPAAGGGTLLGGLGSIHHAFGLPWRLPLWGAYTVLALIVSPALILATAALLRAPFLARSGGRG